MTKEELRTRLLEIEKEMRDNWNELSMAEYDKLLYQLTQVLFDDLGEMSVKVVAEEIFDRYKIDLDYLASEYIDCGDLEKAFKEVTELDDYKLTKTIIK